MKKRPLNKIDSHKFVYTGKPEQVTVKGPEIFAGAIFICGIILLLSAMFGSYFKK